MSSSSKVEFSNELSGFPEYEARKKIRVGYILDSDFSVLRITEWGLLGSSSNYCLTACVVGDFEADWLRQYAKNLKDRGYTEEKIIELVRRTMSPEPEDDDAKQIAKFVYNNFSLQEQYGGSNGIQIKGAVVSKAKQQSGLASKIVDFLVTGHSLVISDDFQIVHV
ncbi:hypothetical protein U2H75_003043 [Escherichia coli]|nr:hypothetical protein [Escherichia coli]HBN7443530.1 hypothetical protein [Escherichia coli]